MNYYVFILLSILSFGNALNKLSFSSFGAVEIGILKRNNEIQCKKYDLYTGISAGALNAGFLSYYDNINLGIKNAEMLYSSMHNRMIYDIIPNTGLSVLNTEPLYKTQTKIIKSMPKNPSIHTLIGATNLYSGKLDIYVPSEVLNGYNNFKFDNDAELIDIGYKNVVSKRYNIC
jgi:hypothetical protein